MKQKLLARESIGFVVIIGLSWFNEVIDLRSLILGNHPYISDFRESTLEMLVVLTVWFLVLRSTHRVVTRVRHLEGFMRVCAWCRRIGIEGHWMPLETYFAQNETRTSHGICEECMHKQMRLVGEDGKRRRRRSTHRLHDDVQQPHFAFLDK
jgi:hypothetical protein